MNRPRHWPKQGIRLLDNYRPLLILTLAILFSLGATAQRYDSTKKRQPIGAYGFDWYNGSFKESLGIPATGQLRPRALADTGQVAYFNGYGYIWALRDGVLGWYLNGGGGGSGSDVELVNDSLLRIGTDTVQIKYKPTYFGTDFSPPYSFQDGDTIYNYPRLFALDSLLWNIYATRQTKSAYLDSLRALVGRFDNALIAPSDTNTVKNGLSNIAGTLWIGDGTKYSQAAAGLPADIQLLGDTALRLGADTLFFNQGYINVYNGSGGDTLARDSSAGLIVKSINANIPSIYKTITPQSISYNFDQWATDSLRTTAGWGLEKNGNELVLGPGSSSGVPVFSGTRYIMGTGYTNSQLTLGLLRLYSNAKTTMAGSGFRASQINAGYEILKESELFNNDNSTGQAPLFYNTTNFNTGFYTYDSLNLRGFPNEARMAPYRFNVTYSKTGGSPNRGVINGATNPLEASSISETVFIADQGIKMNNWFTQYNALIRAITTTDTINGVIDYMSGKGTAGQKVINHISFYSGGTGVGQPGKMWGFYQQNAGRNNFFEGEVRIGDSTDRGDFKLQVNGKAYLSQADSTSSPMNVLTLNRTTGAIQVTAVPSGGGGGGLTSITAGLRLTGGTITTSGTIGIDTAALSGAYIKNQYAAKEAKQAWLEKLKADSLTSGFITVIHNNANGGVIGLRDKGPGNTPTTGDNLVQFEAGGYVADALNLGRRGGFRVLASQPWSNTANGTTLLMDVTANDSVTARVRGRLWSTGFGVSAYGTSLGSTSLTPPATLFVEKSGGNTNATKALALHDSTGAERAHVTDSGRFQGDAYIGTSTAQALTDASGNIIRGYINTDDAVKAFRALGSQIIAQTVGMNYTNATVASSMLDGRHYLTAVYLSEETTIAGAGFMMATQGVYTADNNNKVALYTYSGGTLTLVASSANNGDLYKAAANATVKEPFTTPYVAQPGLYFVGLLHNSSANTTTPQIRRVTNSPASVEFDFANSAKLSGSIPPGNSDVGASYSMSADVSINTNMLYVFLYKN